jgi:hypothetical protein
MEHTMEAGGLDIGCTGIAAPGSERVVSIVDFDSTGFITCQVAKPIVGGLGTVRDTQSTRSIGMDEWTDICRN